MRIARTLTLLGLTVSLAACASTEARKPSEEDQAVQDYIHLHELESVDSLRSGRTDSWDVLTARYIVYEGRNRVKYLVRFSRNCFELFDDKRVTPDVRWDTDTLRARFDTIRGCRVDSIYAVSVGEAAELVALGESFNRRN